MYAAAQGNRWKPDAPVHHFYRSQNNERVPVTVEEVERNPDMATKGLEGKS